jgi:hypothetical protein
MERHENEQKDSLYFGMYATDCQCYDDNNHY